MYFEFSKGETKMTDKDKEIVIEKTLIIGKFNELPFEIILKFKVILEQLFELMEKNYVTNIKMKVEKQ